LDKLILPDIYLSVKQNLSYVWFLRPSTLGVVVPTYPRDLSPEGLLGFCHSYLVPFLLGLIPGLLCLVLGLFHLLQFFLQSNNLLFGGGQLILNLTKEHALSFNLPLSII